MLDSIFCSEGPKQVKRSRVFVGVFAEFLPQDLLQYMQENQRIPPGVFHWAQEIGLRPMTQCDALHLPGVLPGKSAWYAGKQIIVPMFVPTPAKSPDPMYPYTSWHADQLATMLCVETADPNRGIKNYLSGVPVLDVTKYLQDPDTIMVFWA